MSLYNVPFTSQLEMWSPSPSVTMNYYHHDTNFNNTAITVTEPSSRFFHHHEVLLYPSACIVCGLPHHLAPHTVMQYQTASPAITTPAPTESYIQPMNTIKRSSRSYKRHIKPHKKISLQFKYMTRKLIRILALVIKAPLTNKSNIHPVKRDRAD